MKTEHVVQTLFASIEKSVVPYPPGVEAVPEQILGTSFFPGGTGLWFGDSNVIPKMPIHGVMVLGHDFHSVDGYKWARQHVVENLNNPTWRNVRALLALAEIPLQQCFFTNVYMGLRQGEATTGRFPGAASPAFVQRCRDFFLMQIRLQQPALVLALGSHVPPFLATLAPQLSSWASPGGFRQRDADRTSLQANVQFVDECQPCVVASVLHPSLRPSNVRRRSWQGLVGNEAEVALVKEARGIAKVSSLAKD